MCDILPFTGRQNRKKKSLTGESILAPAQRNFPSAFVAGQQISKKGIKETNPTLRGRIGGKPQIAQCKSCESVKKN